MTRAIRPPEYVNMAVDKWVIDVIGCKGECIRVSCKCWFRNELMPRAG